MPEYHVDESGPDHQKSFRATVRIGTQTYGEGREDGPRKEAEQQAAGGGLDGDQRGPGRGLG